MKYTALANQHVDTSGLPRDEALTKLMSSTKELAKTTLDRYPQISLLYTSRLGWIELDIPESVSIEEVQTACDCKLYESEEMNNIELDLLVSEDTAV